MMESGVGDCDLQGTRPARRTAQRARAALMIGLHMGSSRSLILLWPREQSRVLIVASFFVRY
jgi:hypothetical protein